MDLVACGDGEGEPSGGDMNGEGDGADTGAATGIGALLRDLLLCEKVLVRGR
jgi:hypothetical protein